MKKVAALLFVAAAVPSCVDEADLDTFAQEGGVGGGTHEGQGRWVLGEALDVQPGLPGNYLSTSVMGNGTVTFTVGFGAGPGGNGSCLKATIGGPRECADPIFNGYSFAASNGATYTIVSSLTFQTSKLPDPTRLTTGYLLRDATGQPYCAGNHLAYPIAGEVTHLGLSTPTTRLTWACSEYLPSGSKDPVVLGNGVRAKAISWGFPGGPALGAVTGDELQTTATRMGRADYCHRDVSNTIDGTSIGYADFVSGNLVYDQTGTFDPSPTLVAAPLDPTLLYLEAAWPKPNFSGGEERARPLCLSKLRWSTLPVGDLCTTTGTKILDPRITHAGGVDSVYCEDYIDYLALGAAGAVIVNSSQYNDVGVRIWKTTGGDNYTTAIGAYHVIPGPGGANTGDVPPASGFAYQTFLGTVLTSTGRDVLAAAYPGEAGSFEQLQSCMKTGGVNAGERLTSTASMIPAGYGSCVEEGWLWSTKPTAAVSAELGLGFRRLYRFKATSGPDFLTTTDAVVAGYGNRVELGWIAKARQL